jgi:hypothetical protein
VKKKFLRWCLVLFAKSVLFQAAPAFPASTPEKTDFRAKQDAVTHTSTQNQGQSGFCWAYALSGFMEGEAKKNHQSVILSPEYLGFYHMVFQLQKHLDWFQSQTRKIKGRSSAEVDSTAQDAYERIYVRDRFFQPDEGGDELQAIHELEVSGIVPQKSFRFKLPTGAQERNFKDSIKNFIKTNMFDEEKLAMYQKLDDDGLNETLFTALSKALTLSPLKPSESFDFEGKSYTPKTFMADYLHFEPEAYKQVSANPRKVPNALNLIREVMKKNIAVPIGFTVFEDQAPGFNEDASELAAESGDFSTRFCPNGKCTKVEGGHEVLGVNWTEDSSGNVNSIIVKNSWGRVGGRDDRGVETHGQSETGFFVLEADYFKDSNVWNFIVPKEDAAGF